jgi:hypothetical protein
MVPFDPRKIPAVSTRSAFQSPEMPLIAANDTVSESPLL